MSRPAARSGCAREEVEAAHGAAGSARFWRQHRRETFLLLLAPILLYIDSVTFGFVLDDKIVIEENHYVQQGVAGFGKILTTESLAGYIGGHPNLVAGSRYRPLSMLTFALEHELYGSKPGMSHLINVLLYALTILALFRFFAASVPENDRQPWYFRLPFLAALLFALHPLHSEVVANIKGRDEILALLFALMTLLLTYRYIETARLRFLGWSGAAFLLALLAKENAITFLAVVPISVFIFTCARPRMLAIAMTPLAISALLFLLLRYQAVGFFGLGDDAQLDQLMNNPFLEASAGEKYGTIFYTWGLYLKLLLFPHPLTHDYYPYQIPLVQLSDPRAIASLIAYLAMTAYALRTLRKGSLAAWSVLFFLATFSIASNLFFPIGTFMNERFMYVPSVAYCLLLAWMLSRGLPRWLGATSSLSRWIPATLAAVFALGFSWQTLARVPDWRDDDSLNRAGVEVSSGSARANCFMAYSLYEEALDEPDEARRRDLLNRATLYLDRSLAIYPVYAEALNVYAGVLTARYLLDDDIDALLAGFFEIVTRNEPPQFDEFLSWLNGQERHPEALAAFYRKLGYEYFFKQRGDAASAQRYLEMGHRASPNEPLLLAALGSFWLERQDANGELETRRNAYAAMKYAEEGIALDPTNPEFRQIAAAAHRRLGDPMHADREQGQASPTSAP